MSFHHYYHLFIPKFSFLSQIILFIYEFEIKFGSTDLKIIIIHVQDCFPTIASLLRVLLTLPVSTATPERTFSTLGRIFSDRRQNMTTERLSNLAVLSTHFKEASEINLEDAVNIFAASNRRLKLC